MTQITQFPRYSQKENWGTNHTLLLMRRLYEFNPSKFRLFLEKLGDESADIAPHLGVVFGQQIRGQESIPDGGFMQESVKVIVETKTGTPFDRDQIRRHLDGLKKVEHGLLILLSPTVEQIPNVELTTGDKPLLPTTFANVIKCAQECLADHDEEMMSVVDDFEAFCSEEGLLPRDDFMLMMVPCGHTYEVNKKCHLYYYPANSPHRNTGYLGIYTNKSIRRIGEIKKRVECTVDLKAGRVITDDLDTDDLDTDDLEKYERRILNAAQAEKNRGGDISHDHKFYICDKLVPTDFKKNSAGGLRNCRYLDLGTYFDGDLPSVEEIANRLKNESWD